MSEPSLEPIVPVPPEVIQAATRGELIFFVGSGVSQRLNLPSWDQLANKVLEKLASLEIIDYNDVQALKSLDPRKKLSIAQILKSDLDYENYFTSPKDANSDIYNQLNKIGCTFVTTNYDVNLEPPPTKSTSDSTTQRRGTRITSCTRIYPNVLDDIGNVIHLHGVCDQPSKMVLTMSDYLKLYDNKYVQALLVHLFKEKTVVFIGYGLKESEILEHILRQGAVREESGQRRLFKLQGFYSSQICLYKYLQMYYQKSFGLELLGFRLDDKSYEVLDRIVEHWANRIDVKSRALSQDVEAINEVLKSDKSLI
ncbi:MAG: SIR2 family protein [Gammaproteobacteria bacterium]|nr:SIR2 family protein [Gammaproteobacteria bacterium]